jgi:Fic family protein
MANKMTKIQMFNAIKAVAEVSANADMVAFIDHEIDLIEHKSANKKATKTQVENEGIKAEILYVLTNEGATVTDIQGKSEVLGGLSNQRVSALLRQLVESGAVVKTVDKKKSFFSVAE